MNGILMKNIAVLLLFFLNAELSFARQLDDATSTKRRGLQIEEVVVTAQKRSESIHDVSIAIAAYSGDDLAALGVVDTRDMSNLVPGFRYAESGYNTPVYSLRGVGFNESSQTASATVGVYVDEVNLPFAIMSKGANLDLERVEVLKGPQGTLYGRNTTGGAINYIANRPDHTLETGIKASYGRFQSSDIEAYISGPLSEAVLARLAFRDIRSQEGWQKSSTRPADTLGKTDKQSLRFLAEWQASDKLDASLTLSAWRDESEPQAPQAIGIRAQNAVLGDLYESAGLDRSMALSPTVANQPIIARKGADPREADWSPDLDFQLHDSFYSAALRLDYALTDDVNVVWLSAYQYFESADTIIPQSGIGATAGERALDVDTEAYSAELRLDGVWGSKGEWLAGLFYSQDDVEEIQDIFVGDLSTGFPNRADSISSSREEFSGTAPPRAGNMLIDRAIFSGTQTADSMAAFVNSGYQLSDKFKVNVGLRYTRESRDFTGCTRDSENNSEGIGLTAAFVALSLAAGGNGMVPSSGCASLDEDSRNPAEYIGSLEESNVSGRIALDWTPTETLLAYLSYSRGFKSGSFPILSASEGKQYDPVTQEQLDAFEVGFKSTFLDEKLQLNSAAFYYDYQDKQLLGNLKDPIFGPVPLLVNAPESEVIGFEFEAQYSPFDGLFLSTAVAYLQTEVQEFIGTDESGNERSFAGNEFNFTPNLEYTLLANYVFDVIENYFASVGVDYSYTGETNSSLGNEPEFAHDEYFLINARMNLSPNNQRWTVGLWGRNLTNELTTISIQKAADPYARYVGMTRTYGLRFFYLLD
jgi:iron complex outermembrane receptor protein